ncbi:unnamed protein product [Gemmataceae bacterium]|nr:unnamed protein product [Gemmataceae bacterium]VTT99162.1 unnamed protein product [Gemmataceae bacterium]
MARRVAWCVVLLVPVSAPAAPVPKGAGAAPVYFPTAVGAKWVYERDGRGDETVVVAAVEKDGDALVVAREGTNGNATVYAKVVVSPAGLRQDRTGPDGSDVAVWLLKVGVRAGDSWDAADGGKRTVHEAEKVVVPAGTFTAVRVVWEHEGGAQTSWYAPGVGEVKRVVKRGGDEVVTRALKSFRPKAEPNE